LGFLSVWVPDGAAVRLGRTSFGLGRSSLGIAAAIISYQLVVLIRIGHAERALHGLLTQILERI
jgi:hypothetical protein